MKLKDVTVKRIAPGGLPSILCCQLNYKYHTELGRFVVMFDKTSRFSMLIKIYQRMIYKNSRTLHHGVNHI